MKKMLLAAAFFGLTHLSFAQTKSSGKPKMRWGVKSGFTGSYTSNGLGVDPNVFKSPGIRATVYLGLYYQLSLAEKLTLQQELVYSPEGSLQEGKLGANNTFY